MSALEAVIHALRWSIELLVRALDWLPALMSLGLVSGLTAVVMLLVVRVASPQKLVARARDRMSACIYEMRLFLDAPGRVLRAQGRLLGWTAVYMAGLMPAAAAATPVLGLLYLHLETRHGLAPLPAPSTAVLRIELADGAEKLPVSVRPVGAVKVTAPLVRAQDEAAVYARLAIGAPGRHRVTVTAGGETVDKRLDADPDATRVSPERRAGLGHLVSLGDESPPEGRVIRAVSVQHPERSQSWLGLAVPWWLTWLVAATAVALFLRRRFGVAL
jgi:hypothetical protein